MIGTLVGVPETMLPFVVTVMLAMLAVGCDVGVLVGVAVGVLPGLGFEVLDGPGAGIEDEPPPPPPPPHAASSATRASGNASFFKAELPIGQQVSGR